MSLCRRLLFFCLTLIVMIHCSVQQQLSQRGEERPRWRSVSVPAVAGPGQVKGAGLRQKLLRLDELLMENEVMEPKRKRSFPGNNAPIDRLSINSMETKQTNNNNKQSKGVELPRRRANPPPIDRIGASRLPNNRG